MGLNLICCLCFVYSTRIGSKRKLKELKGCTGLCVKLNNRGIAIGVPVEMRTVLI